VRYIVNLAEQIVHCPVLCMVAQHEECIALGGQILLAVEHFLYEVWRILKMLLSLWKLVNAVDCQHSVAAHI